MMAVSTPNSKDSKTSPDLLLEFQIFRMTSANGQRRGRLTPHLAIKSSQSSPPSAVYITPFSPRIHGKTCDSRSRSGSRNYSPLKIARLMNFLFSQNGRDEIWTRHTSTLKPVTTWHQRAIAWSHISGFINDASHAGPGTQHPVWTRRLMLYMNLSVSVTDLSSIHGNRQSM